MQRCEVASAESRRRSASRCSCEHRSSPGAAASAQKETIVQPRRRSQEAHYGSIRARPPLQARNRRAFFSSRSQPDVSGREWQRVKTWMMSPGVTCRPRTPWPPRSQSLCPSLTFNDTFFAWSLSFQKWIRAAQQCLQAPSAQSAGGRWPGFRGQLLLQPPYCHHALACLFVCLFFPPESASMAAKQNNLRDEHN